MQFGPDEGLDIVRNALRNALQDLRCGNLAYEPLGVSVLFCYQKSVIFIARGLEATDLC